MPGHWSESESLDQKSSTADLAVRVLLMPEQPVGYINLVRREVMFLVRVSPFSRNERADQTRGKSLSPTSCEFDRLT